MSRTNHGSKGPGYEYWASRPCSEYSPGKTTKIATHKVERRTARYQLHVDQIRRDPPDDSYGSQFLSDWDEDQRELLERYTEDWFSRYEDDWDRWDGWERMPSLCEQAMKGCL